MAKRWQSSVKNACLRGSPILTPRPAHGPKGPRRAGQGTDGPALRAAATLGAGVGAQPLSRLASRGGWGRWGLPGLHDDGGPCSFCISPGHSVLNPVLVGAYRRGFARRYATNDSEAGLKMFGDGWFMRRSKHPADCLWIEFARRR
jgi:hypothetical protein